MCAVSAAFRTVKVGSGLVHSVLKLCFQQSLLCVTTNVLSLLLYIIYSSWRARVMAKHCKEPCGLAVVYRMKYEVCRMHGLLFLMKSMVKLRCMHAYANKLLAGVVVVRVTLCVPRWWHTWVNCRSAAVG